MKFTILFVLLCALQVAAPAFAQNDQGSSPQDQVAAPTIHYDRLRRFMRPVDPVVEYRDAENVVFLDVDYGDLPAFVRADVERLIGTCAGTGISASGIKAYSYVSDLIRARGLSPNYMVDFSGIGPNPACANGPACNDDGCLLLTYNSYGYGQWKQDAAIRNKSWASTTVDDPRASGVPNSSKQTPLTVFDISTACQDGGGDVCHAYRIWLLGGLSTYTPPAAH